MGIEAGRLSWLPVVDTDGETGVGLTGVADERKSCGTSRVDEHLRVLGATMNLEDSRGVLKTGNGRAIFSESDVALLNMFGIISRAEPFVPYTPHHFLGSGDSIKVDVINVGGEGSATDPGHLVFVADPDASLKTTLPDNLGLPFWLELACGLDGTAGKSVPVSTPQDDRPLVVWGMSTDMSTTFVEITDAEGQVWMKEPVPVWAVCGLASGQVPRFIWPRPYVIPTAKSLRIKVTNAATSPVTGGTITLIASRLPK